MMYNKFDEAFKSIPLMPTKAEIQEEIDSILKAELSANNTVENIKRLHSFVDLTALSATDTVESIYNMVQSVNALDNDRPDIPHVAAICVYPNFVPTVKEQLTVAGVGVAAVSGAFPSSQTFFEVKVVETGLALSAGADEIDIVLPVGMFLEEQYQEVADELTELRDLCEGRRLKCILETAALKEPEAIRRASIMALYAGCDFIKTSTGKEFPGASLEAAYVMAKVIKEYHQQFGELRGLKVSGGIRTTEDALKYFTIVKSLLGDEYLRAEHFRIGASSLVADLQKHIAD